MGDSNGAGKSTLVQHFPCFQQPKTVCEILSMASGELRQKRAAQKCSASSSSIATEFAEHVTVQQPVWRKSPGFACSQTTRADA